METYTLSAIRSMLGLSKTVIAGLIDAGFVTPTRGKRREYRFSFQDVVLLRTAYGLQAANIPPRRILRSLKRLKATLPDELPLCGLRIAAVGNDVAVTESGRQWSAESGQLLIDFEVRPGPGNVSVLGASRSGTTQAPALTAADGETAAPDWFDRGVALEAQGDPAAAEKAYRHALRRDPAYRDAALNLGVLLTNAGRTGEAERVYLAALRHQPDDALLHFNLAVACEDMQRPEDALTTYAACLRLDPTMADAHYNAARLHEQLGHKAQAIRHYNEYRRLQR